jgi:hypothetical protein
LKKLPKTIFVFLGLSAVEPTPTSHFTHAFLLLQHYGCYFLIGWPHKESAEARREKTSWEFATWDLFCRLPLTPLSLQALLAQLLPLPACLPFNFDRKRAKRHTKQEVGKLSSRTTQPGQAKLSTLFHSTSLGGVCF